MRRGSVIFFGIVHMALATAAAGDVIVFANRTDTAVSFRFLPTAGAAQNVTLSAGQVAPLFLDGRAHVEFATPGAPKRYHLDANCAYFFGRHRDGRIDLQKIGLGEDKTTIEGRPLPGSAMRTPVARIPVKLLVDEEEPARQIHWERRLSRRLEAASAILERASGVGLRVVAVGTWNSDNQTNDFIASLKEFETEVRPAPGRIAIGFTSQWTMVKGRVHMAGTRGPLHSHILVREGSPQISEPEKLEFLVHELGHHLGAAHSPERGSVMRPVLGDNLAGRSDFRIQFDPVNTLLVAMVGEEIRRRNVATFFELSTGSKQRLKQIYGQLAKSLPEDPAGHHYVRLLNSAALVPEAVAAKRVLQAMLQASVANQALPPAGDSLDTDGNLRRQGDELTAHYVRQAARAARALPDDVGPKAFLVALGVGLGNAKATTSNADSRAIAQAAELPSEQVVRLAVLGEPTIRDQAALAQTFFLAAYVAATQDVRTAYTTGLAREVQEAEQPTGFSFARLAVQRAGVRFAENVLNGRFNFGMLAQTFTIDSFVPDIDGLNTGLSTQDIQTRFGDLRDPRFRVQLDRLDQRILALPAYRATELRFAP